VCKFFVKYNYYVVRFDGTKILIQNAPFDFKGKKHKVYVNYKDNFTFAVKLVIPIGHYLIDEDESNQDQIVIYLEDKI
jgi:hypothetical protein